MRERVVKPKNPIAAFFTTSRIFPVVGLVIIVLIGWPLYKKVQQERMLAAEIASLQKEMDRLQGKNNELEEIIGYLESSRFVEEQARTNLDLKKPGERVVVMKDSLNIADTLPASVFDIEGLDKTPPSQPVQNPQRWLEYFFHPKR